MGVLWLVPVTAILHVVTGILGSGKTTVLQHLLDGPSSEGPRAVVVGEYADHGYDGDVLEAAGATVRELSGQERRGGADAYLAAIRELAETSRYARIFLETSGVADIALLSACLRRPEGLGAGVRLGRTVTVVDAGAFSVHAEHFGDQLWAQVLAADVVVGNKTDRADADQIEAMRGLLAERNPTCRLLFSYMGQVRRQEVMAPNPDGFRSRLTSLSDALPSAPEDFESFVYESDLVCFDRVLFGHELLNLPGGRIARFKGVLASYDGCHGLNGLPGQMDWEATRATGKTRIAFIGLGLSDRAAVITRTLDSVLADQQDEGR